MKRMLISALLLGVSLPTLVSAVELPRQVQRAQERARERIEEEQRPVFERHSVNVGAGMLGYFAGGAPGTSGAWDVRYAYAALPMLSIEAGYTGAAGDAAGPGSTVATILEGDARFNPLGGARVSPYLLAGAGWGAFSSTGSPSDNSTVVVPLGAGADFRIGDRYMTGARLTYRIVAADHVGPFRASADHWQLIARFGAQF